MEVEGDLTVLVEDYPQGGSRKMYGLDTGSEHYELSFSSVPAGLKTGSRLRVRGNRAGALIAVEADGVQAVPGIGASIEAVDAVAAVTGAQKTAVLLVNFSDNTAQPYTKATIQTTVFTNTSNFDLENSYGQTWLTGDVYGYFTIAQSSTVCDYNTLATQAKSAATAAGVPLSTYTRHVIAFPSNACGWWGMATIGGMPTTTWVNGAVEVQVVSHEMGHNFGLDHSHSLDCGTVPICTNGTLNDYGDQFDTMGSSTFHFSAFQKERLGWLNSGSIKTVTTTGTYSLDPYETNTSGFKALKIPIGTTGNYYYVEMRRPVGVDAGLASNANVIGGVLIHQANPADSNSSDLLDMTAADTSWTNPALVTGQSFFDSGPKITIAPVSVGSIGTVTVTIGSLPTCTRANPTVSFSPPQGAAVAAGTAVAFTLSVTNNDSSACAASIFDLADTVPSGWTGTYSASSLTLSSGASGTSTLTVTSAATAAGGSYGFTGKATNRGATSFTATASATYSVAASCARANPTVVMSPSQSAAVAAGTPVVFTVSVTNNDSSACSSSTFDLTSTVSSGWTASYSAGAMTLSPGAIASSTLTVISAAGAANGSYGVVATAKNRGATTYAASGTATYVVSTPCTRANPAVSLSPSQSSGVAAGTAVAFTLSVTNSDGSACAASSFTLTNAVPAGWTGSLSPASLSLSPGASGSATLTVTSAASAANGSFGITGTAKNSAATSFTSTASATYVVSNPCVRANPAVSLSPSQSAGAAAGTTVAFTLSVTNSDNASCTASSFSLTRVVPSGWTGTLSPTSLSLAPGATGTATLSVKSAATAANGSYSVTATAKNSGATAFTSTASATYVVANPCVRANPTVSLSPSQSAGVVAGTAVAFTLSVTNADNSFCTASSFTLTNTVPAGWTASFSPSSLTLAHGASGTATLTVTSPSSAANGSYPVTATAKNSAATAFTSTDSSTYVVSNPCVRANPTVSLSPAQSAGVAAGTAVAFTLSVTNADNSSCTTSSFTLTNAVPAGWTASFSPTSLSLAPGASGSAALTVTSPSSAATGSFGVTATAKNSAATTFTATGSATYVVSNPCARANPLVTLSPGQSAAVVSGTAVAFTLSVTNKDNAACTSSSFTLTSTVPSGWTGTLSPGITLAPGATGTATLTVTSAASAANGSYGVTATAKNSAATAYSATGSATYVVLNAVCVRANPGVVLSPGVSSGTIPGGDAVFTVTVTNNDTAACSASSFDLSPTVPDGWGSALSAASLALAPGGTGAASLTVTSPFGTPDGSYAVSASATNATVSGYSGAGSASYLVSSVAVALGAFSDSFDRPDSPALGSKWAEVAGNLGTTANVATTTLGVGGDNAAVLTMLSGATQAVEADFTSVDNNMGPRFGVILRYQDPRNYYLIYRQTGGSSQLLVSKVVNGVETILKAVSISNPAKLVAFHILGRASGTTLSLDFDGVNKINIPDATFASGRVGFLIGNKLTTVQQRTDNFAASVE